MAMAGPLINESFSDADVFVLRARMHFWLENDHISLIEAKKFHNAWISGKVGGYETLYNQDIGIFRSFNCV